MAPPPRLNTEALFDFDFHATEACAPAMAALGMIAIDWSQCEHTFSKLVWHYVGDLRRGYAVTAALGNKSKAQLLLDLAKRSERSRAVVSRLEFAAKVFNILLENRNSLVHSHAVFPHRSGKLEWIRQVNNRPKITSVIAGQQELKLLHEAILALDIFMMKIITYFDAKKNGARRASLPRIFVQPSKLNPPPPAKRRASRRGAPRRRKSSPS